MVDELDESALRRILEDTGADFSHVEPAQLDGVFKDMDQTKTDSLVAFIAAETQKEQDKQSTLQNILAALVNVGGFVIRAAV